MNRPADKEVHKLLGQLLVDMGIISQKQLDEALTTQQQQGGLLGQILVNLGHAKEEQIAQALTVQYGYPYLPLSSCEIAPEVAKLIPKNVCKQYCLVPVDRIENTLTIAIANPLNSQAVEDIEDVAHCDVQIFISTISDINNAIEKYCK